MMRGGARFRHISILFVVALVAISTLSSSFAFAAEGKRVAFVVGIGTYDNLAVDKQLRNAVNDADGVSTKLTEIGFQVTKASNLTRPAFNAKWQNVLDSLGKDDTFVLFFSGHGVQIDGQNYLLPRDIPFIEYGRQAQLTREAISLNEILTELTSGDRTHPKQSVVILDACRDNPLIPPGYKSASTPRGLAKVPESDGIFVLSSAASNRTALDRLSPNDPVKNSVFTRALLPLLGHKDLSIQELSTRLKDEVWALARTVKHDQRPTYYDGILGRFCLPGCAEKTENESAGMKENLTTTVVRPSLTKEASDTVKVDSPPAPQASEQFQHLAMKQNAPLPQVQPIEKLPSAITGKDGAPMVLVPAGEFMMGNNYESEDERPVHLVYLDSFYIDQHEVTTTRYAKFFNPTYRAAPEHWSDQVLKKQENKPVVGVGWNDATAYCFWAGKRLPTEAEWEKAARGTDQRVYPWGKEAPNGQRANFDLKNDGSLADVGSFEGGKSPYGLYDMAGNVWEWVWDWYEERYYIEGITRNPKGYSSGKFRVIRGGSWRSGPDDIRSTGRFAATPTDRYRDVGFRCAQDVPK